MITHVSPTIGHGSRVLIAILLLLSATGCQRAFYRRQADIDAYKLIQEKANHPHWALENYSIAVDPRSRMYDPYCADCPPMPPDDPEAHKLMHCVDHKRGWPFWHDNGDTPNIENPAWPAYIELDENGVLKVSADDAVRLGLLHSREYQSSLEELYLSALDVSFERFRFDAQFFGGYEALYTHTGRLAGGLPKQTGVGGNSRSDFDLNTRNWEIQKLFTTGGSLVVGFANSLMWQFSGPDDYSSNTLIDFNLVQPLLRGAGRNRVMETLTISERTLLSNVRAMEQYRRGYYVEIITGEDGGGGPSRRGGLFGGAGLEGFTGVGGGFGRVGGGGLGAGGGFGGGGGAGAGLAGGYMGLLQSLQQIRNAEDNVERLRNNLFRLEDSFAELRTRLPTGTQTQQQLNAEILRQDLQVVQARQALFNAESQLLNTRNGFEAQLDSFKMTLGLPPQLCIRVEDNMLDEFQLIDRETMDYQREVERVAADFGEIRQRIVAHVRTETVPDPADATRTRAIRTLEWYPELPQDLEDLKAAIQPIRDLRGQLVETNLPVIEQDLADFEAAIPRRKEWIARLKADFEAQKAEVCALLPIPRINDTIFDPKRLDESLAYARAQFAALSNKVQTGYETHLNAREAKIDQILSEGQTWPADRLFTELYEGVLYPKQAVGASADEVTDIFVVMPADILALQLVQARARTETVELTPIEIKFQQAFEVARKYNLDWMNRRAALVDAYRSIEFVADRLESDLSVFFRGDISNVGDNPFNLNSDTGHLRAGVQFDAPLTRVAERNQYRQVLIDYQQARRSYYAFEDTVAQGLRGALRTVTENQLNFELQRQAVLIAAQQIDRNEDLRIDSELTGQAASATATRDAVSALDDLLAAQNNFMSYWVDYEVLRRNLDLSLGTLQLDSEGLWIDPGRIGEDYGQYDPWLWKTGDCVPGLPLPNEVTPGDVLSQGIFPKSGGHTELLPLPGEENIQQTAPLDATEVPGLGGLPHVEGLPAPEAPPPPELTPPETSAPPDGER